MSWLVLIFILPFFYYCFYNFRTAFYFRRMLAHPQKNIPGTQPYVSVIVAARSESVHIASLINCQMLQDYPPEKWELIIVNDHSEDDTLQIVDAYVTDFKNLKILSLPESKTGKKAAIEFGIAKSKGEIILCTDADCLQSPNWISSMMGYFRENTGVVSGPVKLKSTGSIFENMQVLEFMGLVATGAAAIESGKPTLANGANFAYRKSAFTEAGGFGGNANIPSGDDEFLLHKIAASGKYAIAFASDKNSIVTSQALSSLRDFQSQRIRWVSKSLAYIRKNISLSLSVIWTGMWLFPLLMALSFLQPQWITVLALAFFLKITSEFLVLAQAAGFFDNLGLLLWLVPESILHILYVIWVGIAGNTQAYTWKKREYVWKR